MTIILAGYLAGEGHFTSERYRVCAFECDNTFGYWRGLGEHWDDDDTLVNVEHDIAASDELIDDLLACPRDACTFEYVLHWPSCGVAEGVLAQKELGGEWCSFSGLGLIKLTPEARIAPLRKALWPRVEQSVHDSIRRPWHLHLPRVDHWHF